MIRRRRQTKSQPDQPLGATGAAKIVRGALIWSAMFPNVLTGRRTIAAASEGAYNGAPVGAAGLGRRWTRSANAGVSFGSAQAITQQSGVTVLVVAAPTSASVLKVPFSQRIASGAYTQTDFVFNSVDTGLISSATAGAAMLASYHNAGTGVAANGQVDGRAHCWVAGNGEANGYIYRDGKKQTLAANTRTPAVLSAAGQQLRIGNIANDAATSWVHDDPLYLVIVWNGLLHESVAASLSANHRQIERRRRRRVFQTVGGSSVYAGAAGASQSFGIAQPVAQVALAGIGVSAVNGGAAPSVAVPLEAAGIDTSTAVGSGQVTVSVTAAALAQAAGQAGLSAGVLRAAAAAALASGNATLAALLAAQAAGADQAGGSATLSGGAPGTLAGHGGNDAAGSATLSVTINLQAAGTDQVSGTAAGQANAPGALAGAGSDTAAGWATISTLVTVTAAGFVQAMAAGVFSVMVPLAAVGQSTPGGVAGGTVAGAVRNFRIKSGVALCTRVVTRIQPTTRISHGVSHG